jgi:hypothetical protein
LSSGDRFVTHKDDIIDATSLTGCNGGLTTTLFCVLFIIGLTGLVEELEVVAK